MPVSYTHLENFNKKKSFSGPWITFTTSTAADSVQKKFHFHTPLPLPSTQNIRSVLVTQFPAVQNYRSALHYAEPSRVRQ